jgi:ELWxxDGT repeat protein
MTGLELWGSDDPHNSVLLQEIAPGPGSSAPEVFTRVRNLVFFTANDNTTGRELWVAPSFAQHVPEPAVAHLQGGFPGVNLRHGVAQFVYEFLETLPNSLVKDPDYPDPEP